MSIKESSAPDSSSVTGREPSPQDSLPGSTKHEDREQDDVTLANTVVELPVKGLEHTAGRCGLTGTERNWHRKSPPDAVPAGSCPILWPGQSSRPDL